MFPDRGAVVVATGLLLWPRDYIRRATERIDIADGVPVRTTTLEIVLDGNTLELSPNGVVAIPVLAPLKNQVPTGLEIRNSSNQLLPTLANPEREILIQKIKSGVQAGGLPATIKKLEEFLSRHDIIFTVTPVPTDQYVIVQVRSEVDYFTRSRGGVASRVRNFLGFKPYVLRLEVPAIRLANTYDLEIVGPTDHYVRYEGFVAEGAGEHPQPVVKTADGLKVEPGDLLPVAASGPNGGDRPELLLLPLLPKDGTNASAVTGRTRASGTASLHASETSERFRDIAQALILFNERPPGSLGSALMFGGVVWFALLICAISYSTIVSQTSVSSATALIVLTIPGTIAIWLRPKSGRGTAVDPPLTASLSLLLVGFTSFATGLSIFLSNIAKTRFDDLPSHHSVGTAYGNANDIPLCIWGWRPSIDGIFLRGSDVAIAGVIFVSCTLVFLVVRNAVSRVDFRSARNDKPPRALPSKLVSTKTGVISV